MEAIIKDVVSTVHAFDGDAILAPQTMERIVRAVMQAMDERDAHRARVHSEQRISGGVREEQEQQS